MRAQHLVIDRVRFIGTQQLACWQRQHKLGVVAFDGDELGKRADVVFQRPVKRLARNALRHQPGQHQADGPQEQQRSEHPVQDFPEQGALLTLEDLHALGIFSRQ